MYYTSSTYTTSIISTSGKLLSVKVKITTGANISYTCTFNTVALKPNSNINCNSLALANPLGISQLDSITNFTFEIFPNPSNGDINLLYSGKKSEMVFEIYNYLGIKIDEVSIIKDLKRDYGFLTAGIYFIKPRGFSNYVKRFVIL